jgi:hypothetical protein
MYPDNQIYGYPAPKESEHRKKRLFYGLNNKLFLIHTMSNDSIDYRGRITHIMLPFVEGDGITLNLDDVVVGKIKIKMLDKAR